MTTALAVSDRSSLAEQVAIYGDLSKLTPDQRMAYYSEVCDSLGLNPLTRPFDYITLNGKMVLYAKKDAADQLRKVHGVDIFQIDKSRDGDLFSVTAYAKDKTGRQDADMGVVSIRNLAGEALANAMMKCITKAKRRVTLSICGLGWLDETELETIQNARPIVVTDAGEVVDPVAPTPISYADRWLAAFRELPAAPLIDDERQDALMEAFDRATGNEGSGVLVIAWALLPTQQTLSQAQYDAIEKTVSKGNLSHLGSLIEAAETAMDEGEDL